MIPFRLRDRRPLGSLSLPPFSRWQRRPRPFFKVLRELLDREGEITLGQMADAAMEQTCGLLVLLLALPSLVPGVNVGAAPIGGAAVILLGAQMARGNERPWLPGRVRSQRLHKGKAKESLARLESLLERFRRPGRIRKALNPRWTGALIAWIGLLLALPVPVPFGNILPAAVLCLVGSAMLEERASWGWLGLAGAAGVTIYFGASFRLILGGLEAAISTARNMFL